MSPLEAPIAPGSALVVQKLPRKRPRAALRQRLCCALQCFTATSLLRSCCCPSPSLPKTPRGSPCCPRRGAAGWDPPRRFLTQFPIDVQGSSCRRRWKVCRNASAVTSGAGLALARCHQRRLEVRLVSISVTGQVSTVLSTQVPQPRWPQEEEEVSASSGGQEPCCSLHPLPRQ